MTKISNTELENGLKKLLYRKDSIEKSSKRLGRGASVYVNLCEMLSKSIKNMDQKSIHCLRAKVELDESANTANELVARFKKNNREYEDYIKPQIEEFTNKLNYNKKSIQYVELLKEAETLVNSDLFGNVKVLPSNLEHSSLLKSYKKNIAILEKLNSAIYDRWASIDNSLEKCRLEVEMFNNNLQLENLQKRLAKRIDHYENVFLPMYKVDMEEMEIYQEAYIKRAEELSFIGIDPKLSFMLLEYGKNKNDDEQQWLFYTSLRTRVDEVIKAMKDDEINHKEHLHLMTPVR